MDGRARHRLKPVLALPSLRQEKPLVKTTRAADIYTAQWMQVFPTFEFHISRASRDLYGFDDLFFSITGNVVFADISAARRFAQRMNTVREAHRNPSGAVQSGALSVMGLIGEVQHALVARYREDLDPRLML